MARGEKKQKKSGKKAGKDVSGLALAAHPRARRAIRKTKAGAALIAFAVVVFLSVQSGAALDAALSRALPVALAVYVVAWAASVAVWRELLEAELEVARRRTIARLHA